MKKFLFLMIASSLVASAAMAAPGPNKSEDCSKVIADLKKYNEGKKAGAQENADKDGEKPAGSAKEAK